MAPDGGLYVPRTIPRFPGRGHPGAGSATFAQTAEAVLTPFTGGKINASALRAILDRAYARFDHPSVAPLVELAPRRWVLELFHGPTLAFKDHALQILGPLIGHFLAERGREAFVLCATSGDTGGAALAALEGPGNIRALVLYPKGGISAFQEAQMHALAGPGRRVVAVDGSFDDCQRLVKQALGDAALRDRYGLTAVNSVNWGRIAAQAVYYAHAALRLSLNGDPVDFAVPTGNFGNAYSGLVAQRMGFPVGRLLVVTNENDTLVRFAKNRPSLAPAGRADEHARYGHPAAFKPGTPAARPVGQRSVGARLSERTGHPAGNAGRSGRDHVLCTHQSVRDVDPDAAPVP